MDGDCRLDADGAMQAAAAETKVGQAVSGTDYMVVDAECAPSGKMTELNSRSTLEQAVILKRSYVRRFGLTAGDLRIARIKGGDTTNAVFVDEQGNTVADPEPAQLTLF